MKNFNQNRVSRGKDKREDRQMHTATCADCGRDCKVPFKPSRDKPVYCSNCFKRDSNPRGDERRKDNRGGNDRGRSDMHKATCADCGKSCEVPFRPSGDKPVYCSICFDKGSSSGPSKPDQSNKKHAEINVKLDKILSLLQRMNPANEGTVVKPRKEEEAPKEAVKKAAPKKAAKKVAPKKATKKVAPKKVK